MTDVTPNKGIIGRAAIVNIDEKFLLNQRVGLLRINLDKIDIRFLQKFTNSHHFREYSKSTSGASAQANLSTCDIKKAFIFLPPLPEQEQIARILDTVDKAIAQTETLIAKYKRVKTGLMQDLLTRGIDEHGQLRDPKTHKFKRSPLGMIPDEWDVGYLRLITDLQVGYAFKSKDFLDNGVRLLRGENVGYGEADWSDSKYFSSKLVKNFDEYILKEDDIVIGMDRTFTKQGCKISVLKKEDTPALLVQRVGRFLTESDIKSFLKVVLSSEIFQAELQKQEKGMDIPHLSKEEILNILICIPPKKEMIKISAITAYINQKIYITRLNLFKLQKIKTGLMQDLLTGKTSVKPLLTNQP